MNPIPADAIRKNSYIGNSDTLFKDMMMETLSKDYSRYKKILKQTIIHAAVKYPGWSSTTDIFQFINRKYLKRLTSNKAFFIWDFSYEGFSGVNEFPFFDLLYFNCEKYNVDPSRIIYVSANVIEEQVVEEYARTHNVKPFSVFSFPSFEQVVARDDGRRKYPTDVQFKKAYEGCVKDHNTKIFSSLSRVNREHRKLASFMLWNSSIKDYALMSHDKTDIRNLSQWLEMHKITDYTEQQLANWLEALPLIVDRTDFNNNWAVSEYPYDHIHDQTIFQIVNETQADNRGNTTLFYSEKTFRPVGFFQPFVIFGQPGCNHYLKELGYKLYDEWFDLSFDFEPDTTKRYRLLLEEVTRVTNMLVSMSKEERIQWRFKNVELLKHNFNIMINSTFSKTKLENFFLDLNARAQSLSIDVQTTNQ